MELSSITKTLRKNRESLNHYGVKSLAIFGSYARNDASPSSDIDLLVEFDRAVGLFEFIRLKNYLENLTRSSVDLVTPDALRDSMREKILREAINVC
jgi:predicted nucleotidyltransferase